MAANETRRQTLFAPARPAVGGGGRQPRRVLLWQAAIGVLIIVLGLAAKHVISSRETGNNPLIALPGGNVLAPGIDIGGVATDDQLIGLAGSYDIDAVVNLTNKSVGEQATCAYLHLSYVHMTVPSGAAPTLAQLHTLTSFMHSHTSHGAYVYLHDERGGGAVIATASMLLLLRGESWDAIQQTLDPGEISALTSTQMKAITDLTSALKVQGRSLHGNPYSGAKTDRW